MNRRQWLHWTCITCAGLYAPLAFPENEPDYIVPSKFPRPDMASDEGGLWAMMEREEKALKRSPLLLRDNKFSAYVQDIACRLAGDHCPDIRVYLVRTPQFNANMAPNGLLQLWTGLLLRISNEAQLAAVIGHEIGHFLQRHSLARLRDIKDKAAFGQVLGLFGLAGLVGQLAVQTSAFGYQRDHEREADRIGAILMHRAGYSVAESAKVWDGMLQEMRARDDREPSSISPLFATHPPSLERRDTLAELAKRLPGGTSGSESYFAHAGPYLAEWCEDEVKRGQFAESITLFTRLAESSPATPLICCFRGEAFRLRGNEGDQDLALNDYRQAAQSPSPVPRAFRGIGLIERQRNRPKEAASALKRYLELAPDSPDAALMKSYVEELTA